eukprot:CAMPEP_0113488774 /NCGR_PEP_ID=MMETSP0014_2-20120614/26191_1 /TAXON_ID=2857 /ORGANISM="Nitzschia sp." /LENGTH=144 /DNA_ID=CAMNT_0000382499 /DNA_START=143 /DNA_END=577 /DNA_ORIENTATION=- /assembly_acc=CAM_ASM_000159
MGVLKHFVCPAFILIHLMVTYKTVLSGQHASIPGEWGWKDNGEPAGELTEWERHAIGIIGGTHAAMLVGHVLGLTTEHGHFRAIMAAMELVSWGCGAYDAYTLGFEWMFAAVMAGLAAVGLAAHSMEPGLFTKDKNASSSSKKE